MNSDFNSTNINKIEKEVLDVINKYGNTIPVGTNALNEAKPDNGFMLLFLSKSPEKNERVRIKRLAFGHGMTVADLQLAFENLLSDLLSNRNVNAGRA